MNERRMRAILARAIAETASEIMDRVGKKEKLPNQDDSLPASWWCSADGDVLTIRNITNVNPRTDDGVYIMYTFVYNQHQDAVRGLFISTRVLHRMDTSSIVVHIPYGVSILNGKTMVASAEDGASIEGLMTMLSDLIGKANAFKPGPEIPSDSFLKLIETMRERIKMDNPTYASTIIPDSK